jgi:4-diphosphocytidyl-2-C-methyl-D-erythritol kinase
VRELAPAKLNLCLLIGPQREDGRHELLSVMAPITLCDSLELSDGERDEVHCPGVAGPNLVERAIAGFRAATGWDGPPQRIEIVKRIPVAAGLGGGSADAAAALRLLARRSGLGERASLLELAANLGSDVASQLEPGRCVVRGGGERVERLADGPPFGVLVLPSPVALSTAAVYREADRLGSPRSAQELAAIDPLSVGAVNDLAQAALSLQPTIAPALALAAAAGAREAIVAGSGPTVIGLFDQPQAAAQAAARLLAEGVNAIAARPFPRSAGALR